MRKKRVFIAINLPDGVRDVLEKLIAALVLRVPESVRFTPPEFLHFTLTFLGYHTDEDVGEIVAAMRDVVPQCAPPEMRLTHIAYGPPGRTPRMIWAMTDTATSRALDAVKAALEDALQKRGVQFERETRGYHAHLTLARLENSGISLPRIDTPLALRFTPEHVDLMESHLRRSGAEYAMLAAVEFGELLR